MKIRLRYLITAVLAGGILVTAPVVLAEDGTSGSSNTTTTSNTSSGSDSTSNSSDGTTQTETVQTETENENHTTEDRVAKLKALFKVKLTIAEVAKVKLHCVAAQGIVSQLNDKFGNSVTVRTKAYAALQDRLNKLITNLKAKNVDTAALQQEVTELSTKFSTYSTDLAAYKQSLADLKVVDCKADPDGFQAALQAARAAHDKVVNDVLSIRTYLINTVKPTLQSILKDVESSNSSTSNTANGSN